MPKKSPRLPRYRIHRGSGQAVIEYRGERRYLGVHGSQESLQEYARVIAAIKASSEMPEPVRRDEPRALTLNELMVQYLAFAATYYTKSGRPTGHVDNRIKPALKILKQHFGHMLAKEFGPLALKRVRSEMIAQGNSRSYINGCVDSIKRMFKWAASEELVPGDVYRDLLSVSGLRQGRSEAKETAPVKPVPQPFVAAIEPYVRPRIWAMVQLQLLTGMRPGEVCIMRTCDIDTRGEVWEYRPESHKTEHHGHEKIVLIGPKAQEILRPWLRTDLRAYLFQPREAEADRNAQRRRNRRTPMTPSQARRKPKDQPERPKRDHYDANSYRQAIQRACRKAGVPEWHPHQLKHNAGTNVRRRFGVEAAKMVLGHRDIKTSEIYAERDLERSKEIVRKLG